MRVTLLRLSLVCGLVGSAYVSSQEVPKPAAVGSELLDLGAHLDAVQKLIAGGEWAQAGERLSRLLRDPRVSTDAGLRKEAQQMRSAIERFASLCAFHADYVQPKLGDLVSGTVVRYDGRSGKLKIRYDESSLADMRPAPVKEDLSEGEKRVRAIQKVWGATSEILTHPAVFRRASIRVEGPSYHNMQMAVCVNADRAYIIAVGQALSKSLLSRGLSYVPTTIVKREGVSEEKLLVNDWGMKSRKGKARFPMKTGERYRVDVRVSGASVSVSYNRRKIAAFSKKSSEKGQIVFNRLPAFSLIEIDGYAEPAWADGLFDAHRRDALAAFEKSYDVREHLPAWLWEGEGSEAGHVNDRGLALELGPTWAETHTVETEHYIVATDIDKRLARDVAQLLERALSFYRSRLRMRSIPVPETKFRVYIFSSETGFDEYVGDVIGPLPLHASGLYTPTYKQLLLWNLPERSEVFKTARHEGFHQFFDTVIDDAPIWLNEGMADYFEVGLTERGLPSEGKIQPRHLRALKTLRRSIKPVRKLMTMSRVRFYSNPQVHYAQSWAMVRFLRSSRKHKKVLADLIDRLLDGESSRRATRSALAEVDQDELEADFGEYLSELLTTGK